MEALYVMILAASIFIVINMLLSTNNARDSELKIRREASRCDIHTWERANGILVCSKCGFAPETRDLFNKLDED